MSDMRKLKLKKESEKTSANHISTTNPEMTLPNNSQRSLQYLQQVNNTTLPPIEFTILPLLGYRTQRSRKLPPPPPRPTTARGGSTLHSPGRFHRVAGKHNRRDRIPAIKAFISGAGAALHERRAGFDGQCGHLLGLQAVL